MKLIFFLMLSIFATIDGQPEPKDFLPYVGIIDVVIYGSKKSFSGTRLNREHVLTSAHELIGLTPEIGPLGTQYPAHVTFYTSTKEKYRVIEKHVHSDVMRTYRLDDIAVLTFFVPSEGSDIAPIFLQKSPSKCISREAFYDSYEIVENVLEARIMTVDILSADGCKKAYNIDISLNQFCGKAPLSKVFLQHDMGAALFQESLVIGVLVATTYGTQDEKTVLIGVFAKVSAYDKYITESTHYGSITAQKMRQRYIKKKSKGENVTTSSNKK